MDLLDIFFGHRRASWCQSWGNGWALAFFREPTIAVEYVAPLKTRSSWLNCALRDDEAVYWVSIGHYEAVAVGI